MYAHIQLRTVHVHYASVYVQVHERVHVHVYVRLHADEHVLTHVCIHVQLSMLCFADSRLCMLIFLRVCSCMYMMMMHVRTIHVHVVILHSNVHARACVRTCACLC